ncbi:MAG: cache domain-containing protein, partial [Thermodesulfobacteriota bacterium]
MERPPFSRLSAIAARKAKVLSLRAFLTRLIWLCVLPLLLLAIYIAVNHVETLQAQRDEEASDQALNVATAIDRQIKEQIAALEMLAASPLLDDPLRLNEFYNQARVFRESFGGHVILADLSMQMLLHTREPFGAVLPKLPQPSGHAAAPAVLETGKPAVGDMFFGPIAKEPLVAVAAPVIRDDRTRLLLLSIIETRQFQRRLDEVSLRVGWSLTVLDGKNEIMARGSSSEMEGLHSGKEPAERFIAKSAVSHWSVVLEVPRSVYRGPIVAATAALAVTILAATLFSVLGGRLAAHRLARSVTSLAETSPNASSRPTIAEIEAVRQTLKEAAAAQKSAESTLRESEERFAKAFENSPDAITIT